MLPVLQIGPLAVQTPGLVWLLGLWLGLSLASRRAGPIGVSAGHIEQLSLWGLILGIVGARLGFFLRYPDLLFDNPLSFFSITPGMLDISGGLLAAGLVALVYGQRHQLPFWNALDAFTPLAAVLVVASGLAQLASGSGFGAPTTVPWGIELWGALRHPSQVYAVILALAVVWLIVRLTYTAVQGSGLVFSAFLILSSLARIFLETFRGDSLVWAGGLRAAQVVAFIILAASLWLFWRRLRAYQPARETLPS